MRRRLEQLLNEAFEYDPPRLVYEPSSVERGASPGAQFQGSLHVSHPDEKRCKGFVYSSSPRQFTISKRPPSASSKNIRRSAESASTRLS